MGNINTHLECDERYYKCVGRERDIEKISKYIEGTKKLVIQISGMQKVGKSRVLTQLLKRYHNKRNCVFLDLSPESSRFNSSEVTLHLADLQLKLGFAINATGKDLRIQDISGKIIRQLDSLGNDAVLFLDNVDKGFEYGGFKDDFLQFIKDNCDKGCSKFKVVFTSAARVQLTSNAFVDHEIKPLLDKDIQKLLRQVIREKASESDDDSYENETDENGDIYGFDEEDDGLMTDQYEEDCLLKQILSPSNMIFIDALLKLCFGLPTLAIMMGTELTANDGLIEPRDMVVLIIEDILTTLSPECYPKSDRAEHFQEAIKKIKERRDLMDKMNRYMNINDTAGIDTVVKVVENARSDAEAKQKTRPLLDYNVMMYSRKGKQFKIPAIFRECLLAMRTLEKSNETERERMEEDERIRDLLKLGRLKLADIPGLPESVVNSPRKLEEFLYSLEDPPEQKTSSLISQPSYDDDSEPIVLSTSHDTGEMKKLFGSIRKLDQDLPNARQGERSKDPVEISVHDGIESFGEEWKLNRGFGDNKTMENVEVTYYGINSVSGPQAMSYREVSEPNHLDNVLNDLSTDNSKQDNNQLDSFTNIEAESVKPGEIDAQVDRVENESKADRSYSVEDNNLYDSCVGGNNRDLKYGNNEQRVQTYSQGNVSAGRESSENSTDCSADVGGLSLDETQSGLIGTGVKMKTQTSEYTVVMDQTTPQYLNTDKVEVDASPFSQERIKDKEMTEPRKHEPSESGKLRDKETGVNPCNKENTSNTLFDSD